MAFSDFKAIPDVREKFRVTYVVNNFLGTREVLNLSEQFPSEFEEDVSHDRDA